MDLPRTCPLCGRRGVNGSGRCAAHQREPRQRTSEAQRLIAEPWLRAYDTAAYRRNRRTVLERARGRCEMSGCGRPLNPRRPQVDHIVSLRRGGSSGLENLRALCDRCHARKTAADTRRRRGVGGVDH